MTKVFRAALLTYLDRNHSKILSLKILSKGRGSHLRSLQGGEVSSYNSSMTSQGVKSRCGVMPPHCHQHVGVDP